MEKSIKINEVEQVFSEAALKKAVAILRKHELQLTQKTGASDYVFMIKGTSVHVVRQGGELTRYRCSCGRKNCEHLCAVLLSFQKEIVDALRPTQREERRAKGVFDRFCRKIRQNIFLTPRVAKDSAEIRSDVKKLLEKKTDRYLICLALLNELCVLPAAKADPDSPIRKLITEVKELFREIMPAELSDEQQKILFHSTLSSLAPTRFNSYLFSFLIPYACIYIKSRNNLDELKRALEKRTQKYHYPGALNFPLVASLHLQDAQGLLSKRQNTFEHTAELYIAKAEKLVCLKKYARALSTLKKGYELLKENKPANFTSYIEYIIEWTKNVGDKSTELYFIKEAFIYDFQINNKLIERVKSLLEEDNRAKFFDETIKEIKKSHREVFDKLAVLLIMVKDYEELIRLISKQQNKFSLLNEVAIKYLPETNERLFKVYVQQFLNAVGAAPEHHYQQRIVKQAKTYLDKLPARQREKLAKAMMAGLGGQSHLRNTLIKTFSD